MSSYYWIKLYHEILNDPKMGRLSDHAWRRAIELFLLAGETANEGMLPSANDIAWRLRTTKEEITEDLETLAALGIVALNDDRWHVVNFAKRQAASANAERQRRYRHRKARRDSDEDETQERRESNEGVTECNIDYNEKFADTDTDIESDIESDREAHIEAKQEIDSPPTAGASAPPRPPPKQPKPKRKKEPSPKQREAQEMFTALAGVCQINLTTLTGKQRDSLNQSEKILRKDDAIPADMEPFAVWWYANDWRGKKGDAPRPAQVRETWGKFKTWQEGGQQYGQRTQSTDPRAPNYRPPLIGSSPDA